jgi:antitoxin (DNA-binding transcriptional repressor) of toxin-antitoxin stability system
MRDISIRKLHEATDKQAREAVTESYVVTDRGRPVAVLGPVEPRPKHTPFRDRKLLPAFKRLPKIRGDSTIGIRSERNSR